ncbi:hypothetical protein [Caldicellulosiruptor changbaiensis]|uniref:hypothetical protein n=1 Tax=Caldicellulosiruptor changbaiensis TaxID=1222016 RepID=UPI0019D31B1C|nr:hypothetical protein [Caldicellulosiruptor changbaiensis]
MAKLTIFVRNEFGMRSISHVPVGELAHAQEGKHYVRRITPKVCQRPDDMTEILSYYLSTYGS